jgi:DUF438 domain-containing protein
MKKIEKLTDILLHLNKNLNAPDFGEAEIGLLAGASCREMAVAQQNLLAAGIGTGELWQLWDRNSKILPNQAAKLRAELPENHILQRVLAEHEMILCFAADLGDVNTKIQRFHSASSLTMEIRKLAHIAGHLICSEQHHEREEQVIYPELKRRGYRRLLRVINEQHRQLSERYKKLQKLVWRIDVMGFNDFKTQLEDLVSYLLIAIRIHIFIESNIIFPLAIEVINDSQVWRRMKETCDQIGYCGYDAA